MIRPIIRTFTGRHVNPLDLKYDDIDIQDIAHALALCNRFSGHSKKPISVAQHSYYVHRVCANGIIKPERWLLRQALLHDASEAYLGDVSKWVKQHEAMEGYRYHEALAQRVIAERFGIPFEMHLMVKTADDLMVRFEGRHLTAGISPDFLAEHPNYPPVSDIERKDIGYWKAWSWKMAENQFLKTWEKVK
jgi:hypothetical protein